MRSKRVSGSTFSLLVLMCGWIGCTVDVAAPADEAGVSALEEDIINGNNSSVNSNFVALYHRIDGGCEPDEGDQARGFTEGYNLGFAVWWPRPCSGMIVKKDGNTNYILTARHCITRQGTVDGGPVSGTGSLRATGTLNPGVIPTEESNGFMQVLGSPPAGSVPASVYYQNLTAHGDLAIVQAVGNLQTPSAPLRPAIMGYTVLSDLIGKDLNTSAYGRNIDGDCYSHDESGAGRLRSASGITVTSTSGTSFQHWATNLGGQTIWHGDSGGPLYTLGTNGGKSAYRVYGVHTGPSISAGGAALVDFFQDAFGHVYLINQQTQIGSDVVGVNQVVNGALLINYAWTEGPRVRMRVDRSAGYLKIGDFCMNDEPNGSVRLRACGTVNTRWNISVNGVISNRSTGKCLMRHSGGDDLVTLTCPASPHRWAFAVDQSMN